MLKPNVRNATRRDAANYLDTQVDRQYIVPILMKSLVILRLLRETPIGLRIDQIHAETGVPRSTVYRIVRTYVASGYVEKTTGGFYVSV